MSLCLPSINLPVVMSPVIASGCAASDKNVTTYVMLLADY